MPAATFVESPANGGDGAPSAPGLSLPSAEDAAQGIWLCGGSELTRELVAVVYGQGLWAEPTEPWADPADADEGGAVALPDGSGHGVSRGGGAGGDGGQFGAVGLVSGFGQNGMLNRLAPGPELGLLLPGADDVTGLSDDELTGVVRGWRRMGSWAAAMEHAAVAELVRRRIAEADAAGARAQEVARYAAAEVAAALTLTSYSAGGLMDRAMALAGLPATWAALATGAIDVPKALAIRDGVACLSTDLARAIEAQVVTGAAGQTTGELRKAVEAAIAADPAAADRRVAEAQRSARVERWTEPAGTVAIAGRDLPPAEALAAGNRINALATALKADGAPGGMDLLRAEVFVGLLLGRPVAAPAETAVGTTADVPEDTAAEHQAAAKQLSSRNAPPPTVAPLMNGTRLPGVACLARRMARPGGRTLTGRRPLLRRRAPQTQRVWLAWRVMASRSRLGCGGWRRG